MSDEEVKYTVDAEGFIHKLSKQVVGGLGEAVGINYVAAQDKQALIRQLGRVDDQEYFEGGIEAAIARGRTTLVAGRHLRPVRRRDRLRRRPRAREHLFA